MVSNWCREWRWLNWLIRHRRPVEVHITPRIALRDIENEAGLLGGVEYFLPKAPSSAGQTSRNLVMLHLND